jgi:hypothetical protein
MLGTVDQGRRLSLLASAHGLGIGRRIGSQLHLSLIPLVLRPGEDSFDLSLRLHRLPLPCHFFMLCDFASLRNEPHVKPLGNFIHAVPVRIVGSHDRSSVPRTTTFVVPKVEPRPFNLLIEVWFRQKSSFLEQVH